MNIQYLKSQSTYRLLLLTIATYGVYPVYYMGRITTQVNDQLQVGLRISRVLFDANLAIAYVSLALFIACLFLPEGHPAEILSSLSDAIAFMLMLAWCFRVRNRINELLASSGNTRRFNGLWTFAFMHLYINYRTNALCEEAEQSVAGDRSENAAPAER